MSACYSVMTIFLALTYIKRLVSISTKNAPSTKDSKISPPSLSGGLIVPAPSGSTKNTENHFFLFSRDHNELGKVTKFETSKPPFPWKNSPLK